MKKFLAPICICLVSQLWVHGEPEAAPDFPAHVQELQQQLDKASDLERDTFIQKYIETLAKWLDWEDSKQRPLDQAALHLTDYAATREALTRLQDGIIPEVQKATLERFRRDLADRISRWSAPDTYYSEKWNHAKALWSDGKFSEAAAMLDQALAVAKEENIPDVLFLQGIALLADGDMKTGKDLLEKMVNGWPDSPRCLSAHYVLGHVYWIGLDYEKATAHFEKLSNTFPETFYGKEAKGLVDALGGAGDPKRW